MALDLLSLRTGDTLNREITPGSRRFCRSQRDCRIVLNHFCASIFITFSISSAAYAADDCQAPAGQIATIEGRVEVQKSGQAQWQPATLKASLCQGDTVRAASRSRATVVLANQAVLRIDQSSAIRLINVSAEPKKRSLLSLLEGAVQSFSRKPRKFEVNTPYLNGSIEGTEFVLRVADNRTVLTVLEGRVRAANDQGELAVSSGQSAAASAGKAPQPRTVVRPRDAVQWALHYPTVMAAGSNDGMSPTLRGAIEKAENGDTVAAFKSLDSISSTNRDTSFHVTRASLYLSVGRSDEARKDIERALAQDAGSGLAHALRAVIAVVQNNRVLALSEGRKAVELAPDNAAAYVALSYAQQSQFDLAGARESSLTAVKRQPGDAVAWARLSELHLMFGDRSQAITAAEKSLSLSPGLARAQMALGFAELTSQKIDKATKSFENAAKANSADPLPHLGLGLALINKGNLKAGRAELELAVALDGNNASLRSYLGKAYFEENRSPLEAEQYEIAKQLDPKDPTAYLYQAILDQTSNKPVAALQEVEKSIELNDNRAVYRSRLLLDSDQASRNVSSARIYNDLGFQELALVEGWKSVNIDPSNSSAHRFLADSYGALPRHEIARVSELLQAQMLEPLNLAPIQPRAAEGNLFLISAGGPAVASANEFNSLFKSDQLNASASGAYGGMETSSGEVIVGGIQDNMSFSLGGSIFKTNGYRGPAGNSDQADNTGNAFFQAALSTDTSVQFEYRHRDTEYGDLNQHMDGSFSTALRVNTDSDTYRGGLRHAFSPSSTVLVSVVSKNESRSFYDEPTGSPPGTWIEETRPDDKALGTEVQYLYRGDNYTVTAGGGQVDFDQSVSRTTFIPAPFGPGIPITTTTDLSAQHRNAYAYSNIKSIQDVVLTLGASYDAFDTVDPSSESVNQVNPKLGVTWQMKPGTTFRAAGFRALRRSLISYQTLEPTQVAGFNQFYDDVAATDAWRYGVALDQKFSSKTFGGVEVSRRDMSVPFQYTDTSGGIPPFPTSIVRGDQQEESARAYLFMTPSDRLAFSVGYQYQVLDRPLSPATGVDVVNNIKTHKIPLGVRYFHGPEWTFGATATYVKQEFESGNIITIPFPLNTVTTQNSDFWVVDVSASYRFAKRKGSLAFGATNLLREKFSYEQMDPLNPSFQPARMIYARMTLYW